MPIAENPAIRDRGKGYRSICIRSVALPNPSLPTIWRSLPWSPACGTTSVSSIPHSSNTLAPILSFPTKPLPHRTQKVSRTQPRVRPWPWIVCQTASPARSSLSSSPPTTAHLNLDTIQASGAPLLQASRTGGLPSDLEHQTPSLAETPSALAVRMLFSALVDADLLNTEEWDIGAPRLTSSRGPHGPRGLKLCEVFFHGDHVMSLPPGERGLKHRYTATSSIERAVAPPTGAWMKP